MKLLLISDAAQTGFGRVGTELARRFDAAGVDLRWIAINWGGRAGEVLRLLQTDAPTEQVTALLTEIDADPLTPRKLPAGIAGDGMGQNLTAPAIRGMIAPWPGWRPDCVLVVADPRAMLERAQSDDGAMTEIPTYNYVPIEGGGLPPFWRIIWERITPVAMSDFGRQQLETLLGRPVPMVPHGISEGFYPVSTERPGSWKGKPVHSKDQAKSLLGFAGKTVLLRTDRLVVRKDYPALFRSLAPVLARHPEVVLVIHCAPIDEGGVLPELLSHVPGAFIIDGRWSHPQIRLTRGHDTFRGLSDDDLNVLYNAADIYVSPTMAEGFGLTLAEAAAVGCPVVTTDYAAGPEACGPGAVLVPARTHYTNIYAHEWALVDEDRFGDAVEHLIEHPARRRELGEAGRRYVTGRFTWDKAAAAFLELLGAREEEPAAA